MKKFGKLSVIVIGLFVLPITSIAGEWYEGGTLSSAGLLEWQDASMENKIATSADFVASLYGKKFFKNSISQKIVTIEDFKPYTLDLALCIEKAGNKFARKDLTNQTVSEFAVLCAALMGWGSIKN